MVLQLEEATEADCARAVAIEAAAYGPNPLNAVLFPGPRSAGNDSRVRDLIEQHRADPASKWLKVVDPDLDAPPDEKLIAFASWYVWTSPPESKLSSSRGPGSNPEACDLFFGGMNRTRDGFMEGKPYIYLKLLHTDPKHQKRGAGSLLLEWGLKESGRLGLPLVLESSPMARPLYEKWGFREVDKLTADFSPWGGPAKIEVPLMVRPVNAQVSVSAGKA